MTPLHPLLAPAAAVAWGQREAPSAERAPQLAAELAQILEAGRATAVAKGWNDEPWQFAATLAQLAAPEDWKP